MSNSAARLQADWASLEPKNGHTSLWLNNVLSSIQQNHAHVQQDVLSAWVDQQHISGGTACSLGLHIAAPLNN
jgi:hypothetical protein